MTAPIFVDDMPLTPFLGNVKQRIEGAFVRLLGLGPGLTLRWHPRGEPAPGGWLGTFRLEVRTAVGRQFALIARDATGGEAWRVGEVAIELDAGPDGRGLPQEVDVTEAVAAIRARFEGGQAPVHEVDELRTALALRREFPNQSDEVLFRRVERTTSGTVGMLRLGFRCNQDCFFCPQSRAWQGPDDDLLRTWLDELGAGGLKILTITGGEPTIYPVFAEIVHRAVHHWGMAVFAQTNAVQFAKDSYVDKMREAGLHGLFVSLHSHLEEVSDAVTRAPRTWARTVRGIENAQRAGFGVAINCCVERNNFQTLPEHARFIVERFVKPFQTNPLVSVDYSQPGAYFHGELMQGSIVPYDEIEPFLAPALRILTDAGVAVNATGTCGFVPCMFRSDPSVIPWRKRSRFDDQDLENRRFLDPCRSCAAQPYCVGVRGDVVKWFGDRGLVPYAALPEVQEYRDFDLFQLGLQSLARREGSG
jgi:MoaA/NifB/PqqE/SkfB family radical SAM enzyme